MIVFLTLCYVAILFILVKFKIVKLTLFWKISPVLWFLVIFCVLFIPMQWGAPSGPVTLYQLVNQITPNVSGSVEKVYVKELEPVKEGDILFSIDPIPFQAAVDSLKASLNLSQTRLKQSKELAAADSGTLYDIERYQAEVDSYKAQLQQAQWNLESTKVRATADGYVIGLTLRPGNRVANLAVSSVMAFVNTEKVRLVAGIPQTRMRHVKKGQSAEVVLSLFPGTTFNARVEGVAPMTPQGQLNPSGSVPLAPTGQETRQPYGVILELDVDDEIKRRLYGGALGTAAIYTESVGATHIIRKVMIRMETWLNYLKPY